MNKYLLPIEFKLPMVECRFRQPPQFVSDEKQIVFSLPHNDSLCENQD